MKMISKRPIPLLKPKPIQNSEESSGPNVPISVTLEECVKWRSDTFTNCSDLVQRVFTIGFAQQRQAAIFYFDGLIDKQLVNEHVLQPLILTSRVAKPDDDFADIFLWLEKSVLSTGELKAVATYNEMA